MTTKRRQPLTLTELSFSLASLALVLLVSQAAFNWLLKDALQAQGSLRGMQGIEAELDDTVDRLQRREFLTAFANQAENESLKTCVLDGLCDGDGGPAHPVALYSVRAGAGNETKAGRRIGGTSAAPARYTLQGVLCPASLPLEDVRCPIAVSTEFKASCADGARSCAMPHALTFTTSFARLPCSGEDNQNSPHCESDPAPQGDPWRVVARRVRQVALPHPH